MINSLIGQEVRRLVFSVKVPTIGYFHIFTIFEKLDADMLDVADFKPNFHNEYNDSVRDADGAKPKVYLTVDTVTMTKKMYESPWKDYYSGTELLRTVTDQYKWLAGKDDWSIIPSDENHQSELNTILPRRYEPKYVRYCIPESLPEEIGKVLSDEKLRNQLTELSKRNLGYDIAEHSNYIGGFVFLTYGSIYRKIDFTEKESRDGIYCRIEYKKGGRKKLWVNCKRKGDDGSIIGSKKIELDGNRYLYDLDLEGTFSGVSLDFYDENDELIDYYDHLAFIRSIQTHMRVGSREVHVTDEDGKTIRKIQKYEEGDRTVIGESNPSKSLLDSSPEYAYRKFEEAQDFVFYDGDKEKQEENIRRSNKDILRILNGAHERVYICDVFFDAKSLERFVLPMDSNTMPIRIISSKKELKKDGKLQQLREKINEMNKQQISNVTCRLMTGGKAELHDRYIVADENVWMLGCSLNEFGVRATTLIRVPKEYKQKLIERAEAWWNDDTLTININDVKDATKTKRRCYLCKLFDKLCGR